MGQVLIALGLFAVTGLGLAISSFGVTACPPIFGAFVERLGDFTVPWLVLAGAMLLSLCWLIPAREGRMDVP